MERSVRWHRILSVSDNAVGSLITRLICITNDPVGSPPIPHTENGERNTEKNEIRSQRQREKEREREREPTSLISRRCLSPGKIPLATRRASFICIVNDRTFSPLGISIDRFPSIVKKLPLIVKSVFPLFRAIKSNVFRRFFVPPRCTIFRRFYSFRQRTSHRFITFFFSFDSWYYYHCWSYSRLLELIGRQSGWFEINSSQIRILCYMHRVNMFIV